MPCERCGKQNPADVHTCTASREYMLEIIQKEISDKTLSPGCMITAYDYDGEHGEHIIKENYIIYSISSLFQGEMCAYLEGDEFDVKTISKGDLGDIIIGEHAYDYTIIGHPVMLGDVLDYIDKSDIQGMRYDRPGGNPSITLYEPMVTSIRKEKRKPLSDQSDDCIRYIYSLLPPEVRK